MSLIVLTIHPSLSEPPVGFEGFIICFSTGPRENQRIHKLVVMEREEKPEQRQERRKHTTFHFLFATA